MYKDMFSLIFHEVLFLLSIQTICLRVEEYNHKSVHCSNDTPLIVCAAVNTPPLNCIYCNKNLPQYLTAYVTVKSSCRLIAYDAIKTPLMYMLL